MMIETPQGTAKGHSMLKVTFYKKDRHTGREYRNIETHKTMDDAKLRAYALNWSIEHIEMIDSEVSK